MKHIIASNTHLKSNDLDKPLCEFFHDHVEDLGKCYGWNPSTQREYKGIVKAIAGNIPKGDTRSFQNLDFSDYENAINALSIRHNSTHKLPISPLTTQKRRIIICQLCHFVESAGLGYDDVTWGCYWKDYTYTSFPKAGKGSTKKKASRTRTPREMEIENKLRLPRSLPIRVEAAFANIMFKNRFDKSGICLGGLMMLFLGLRTGECCGVKYGSIQELYPGSKIHVLYVCEQLNSSGKVTSILKTHNSYRVLPIPTTLYQIIEARRKHIQDQLGTAVDLQDFPVVNAAHAYTEYCSRNDFASTIAKALRDCKIDEGTISSAAQELHDFGSRVLRDINEEQERAPTTYVLRRNFATIMASVCRLSGDDLDYLMGHKLSSGRERYEYLDEDILEDLHQKMEKRHLLAPIHYTAISLDTSPVTQRDVTEATIFTKGKATIDIYSHYAMDSVNVAVCKPEKAIDSSSNAASAPRISGRYMSTDRLLSGRIDISDAYKRTMQLALSRQQKNSQTTSGQGNTNQAP